MLGIALILLKQGLPLWLTLAAVGIALRRAARRNAPRVAELEAWQRRRQELEAELIEASHRRDNMDEMLAVQGRIAAHEALRPRLPRWMFWVKTK